MRIPSPSFPPPCPCTLQAMREAEAGHVCIPSPSFPLRCACTSQAISGGVMCTFPHLPSLPCAPAHSRPCARRVRRPLRSCWSLSDQTMAAAAAVVAAASAAVAAAAVTAAVAATHGARQVVALMAATAPTTCLITKAQGRCASAQDGGGRGEGDSYVSLSRQRRVGDGLRRGLAAVQQVGKSRHTQVWRYSLACCTARAMVAATAPMRSCGRCCWLCCGA